LKVTAREPSKSGVREERSKSRWTEFAPARGIEALGIGATCIAAGIILPFFVHPLGLSPRVLLPMHFPVFLAGMLLSPFMAAAVGALTPALSAGLTGMPTPDQTLRMIPELVTYAVATSVMLRIMPVWPLARKRVGRIVALVTAMVVSMCAGRLVYVLISSWMMGYQSPNYYVALLVLPALPGIIAQLILVPPLAYRVQQVMYRFETESK
jgi:hypothetical protein